MRTIILIGLLILSFDSYCCSCRRVGILKDQKQSDLVFKGQVIEINELKSEETVTGTDYKVEYRRFEFTIQVTKIYKGKKSKEIGDEITIITTGGGGDCGYRFDLGVNYLVYAYKTDRKLKMELYDQKVDEFITTHLCTRTKKSKPLTFFEKFILSVT